MGTHVNYELRMTNYECGTRNRISFHYEINEKSNEY